MKLCPRRSVLVDLSRPRLGLSESDVALAQHPRRTVLVMAGACGLTPINRNDEREVEPRPSHPHKEGTLSGRQHEA